MKSLGSRLTYWDVLVVSATVIIALVVGRWLLERELVKGMDLLNDAEYREIVDRMDFKHHSPAENEVIERIAAHSRIDAPLYFFQLRNSRGDVIFRSENMGDAVLPEKPPRKTNWSETLPGLEDVRVGEFKLGSMTLQIAATTRAAQRLLHSYFQVSLGMLAVAAALSIFFGYRLSRLALDPVRRIQLTAQRIGAENLSERILVDRSEDEISDLARLLNQMFDRLEVSFERLWRFAAEASHELKTPLSVIRLQSEKLLLHGKLSDLQNDAIQQQLDSITRLGSVIDKLLFLAKSEVGAITLNLQRHGIRDLIDSVREDAQTLCDDAGVRLVVGEVSETEVAFDLVLLRQVILNLLANALNVTPTGGGITLSAVAFDGRWRFMVEDTGPGLPANRVDDVFEPFVRIQHQSDSERGAGAGLGLAICRSVLDLHDGIIHAENCHPGPGLRVTFELPIPQSKLNEAGV